MVAYHLTNNANGDQWKDILVVFNGNRSNQVLEIPSLAKSKWMVALQGQNIYLQGKTWSGDNKLRIEGSSAMILFRK